MCLEFLGHTDTIVSNRDFHVTPVGIFMRLLSKTAVDFSILPGVFDGIADNIEYNLGQMGTVNIDIRICNLLMYGNSLVLFLNCRIEYDDAGVKTFFNVADAFFENDLVVFNPGNLQDVVNDGEHFLSAGADVGKILA